jgi:hypothetical protein
MKLIKIAHAAGIIEDAPTIPELLMNILNFLLQVFGIIAIIALVVSGIFYLTAAGDEDRIKLTKKSVLYSIIGIVVALSGIIIIKTINGFLK